MLWHFVQKGHQCKVYNLPDPRHEQNREVFIRGIVGDAIDHMDCINAVAIEPRDWMHILEMRDRLNSRADWDSTVPDQPPLLTALEATR